MTDADLASLTRLVLAGAFFLGVVFGAITQRTHFCTMGAVADIVNIGDWTRMRMWLLAIGVAILGFQGMAAAGWIRAADTIYAAPRLTWLSHLVGGALFGFGMVLASGCGSKTLVRVGAGSLKSLVVLIVLGLSSWMTLRGLTALARTSTVDQVAVTLPRAQDLPTLLQMPPLVVGGGVGVALVAWVLSRREGRQAEVLVAGVGLGAVTVALWWLSGVKGFVPEHPQTLEPVFVATSSGRAESFSFVAPVAYLFEWAVFASDASRRFMLAMSAVVGVVVGSFVVAVATRRFRWEGFGGVPDVANHLVGATLMGIGGVTALGCTIGQGLTGVSTLAVGSLLTLAAIVAGAIAGLKFQLWQLERGAL